MAVEQPPIAREFSLRLRACSTKAGRRGPPFPTADLREAALGVTDRHPSFRFGFEVRRGLGRRRVTAKGWRACAFTRYYDACKDSAIAGHMDRDHAHRWIVLWRSFGSGWAQRSIVPSVGDALVVTGVTRRPSPPANSGCAMRPISRTARLLDMRNRSRSISVTTARCASLPTPPRPRHL